MTQELGHPSENELNRAKRRRAAMKSTCEVERTNSEVRFIISTGMNKVIYKLTGTMAKDVGEELFRQGCDLLADQPHTQAKDTP